MKKPSARKGKKGVKHDLIPEAPAQQNLSDEEMNKLVHAYLECDDAVTNHWRWMMDHELRRRSMANAVPAVQREEFLKQLTDLRVAREVEFLEKQNEQKENGE